MSQIMKRTLLVAALPRCRYSHRATLQETENNVVTVAEAITATKRIAETHVKTDHIVAVAGKVVFASFTGPNLGSS